MNNSDTQATLSTRDRIQHRKLKSEEHGPHK